MPSRRLIRPRTSPIITLTTDFGLRDHFVGVMKGVVLSIAPQAEVVDITHGIQSHDLVEAALVLQSSYSFFPAGTIHVVVVDPGVGSSRRPILVKTVRYFFLAPDNGVLSSIYSNEQPLQVYHLTKEKYFLKPTSSTFHGRDIFAPVAAWLSRGVTPGKLGRKISDPVRLDLPTVRRIREGVLVGTILRIDKFGNLITNVSRHDLSGASRGIPALSVNLAKRQIRKICRSYAEAKNKELFVIWGSSGLLEVSANQASAAELLGARRNQEFRIVIKK